MHYELGNVLTQRSSSFGLLSRAVLPSGSQVSCVQLLPICMTRLSNTQLDLRAKDSFMRTSEEPSKKSTLVSAAPISSTK